MPLKPNTITPGDIAEFLRKTAAAFDAMPPGAIPGGTVTLDVHLAMHRHDDDGTTNRAFSAFVDEISAVVGSAPPELDGNVYRTPYDHSSRLGFEVRAWPKTTKPVVEIDPNL